MSTESLSDIKAVFFDLDDTLVETIKPKWEQHKFIALQHYGKVLTDEELRLHWGKPLSVMLKLIYGTEDIEGAFANIALHRHRFPKVLFDGSLSVLEQVRTSGRFLGVVTAHSRAGVDLDFANLGISHDLFDHIQTEESTSYHKPDPRVFEPAIGMLNEWELKPNQAVYVGDGLHDKEAARGAGMHFIGVTTGLVTADEFRSHGALSVSRVEQVSQLILG